MIVELAPTNTGSTATSAICEYSFLTVILIDLVTGLWVALPPNTAVTVYNPARIGLTVAFLTPLTNIVMLSPTSAPSRTAVNVTLPPIVNLVGLISILGVILFSTTAIPLNGWAIALK